MDAGLPSDASSFPQLSLIGGGGSAEVISLAKLKRVIVHVVIYSLFTLRTE